MAYTGYTHLFIYVKLQLHNTRYKLVIVALPVCYFRPRNSFFFVVANFCYQVQDSKTNFVVAKLYVHFLRNADTVNCISITDLPRSS